MTIPGDTDKRWWVEASGANPLRVHELKPAMLAFVSFSPAGEASIEGCGFIIAGQPKFAVAITAKHVLLEGVFRTQRPRPAHASSALFVLPSSTRPSIEPKNLKVNWMSSDNAKLMDVGYLGYNESLDVACCVVTPQDLDSDPFQPISIPIDTAVPCEDDVIQMVSLDGLAVSPGNTGGCRKIHLARRMSIRVGVVTGVYPDGYRQYHWPCFTTSIPAEPGTSGGFVTLPDEGKTIAACGIVCADNSTDEARAKQAICGESVIACAWPALTLRLPDSIPSVTNETRSLYNFMLTGDMPMAIGGIDHVDMIELQNGDCKISLRKE